MLTTYTYVPPMNNDTIIGCVNYHSINSVHYTVTTEHTPNAAAPIVKQLHIQHYRANQDTRQPASSHRNAGSTAQASNNKISSGID